MDATAIRFDDGGAYEGFMGVWSRLAGDVFLDWLAPPSGLHWADVGCGNGAFTARLLARCAPVAVDGIDPSEEQLAYARTRLDGRVRLRVGDAMALPWADDAFDAAVMALVIFFVPDPATGTREMARVVRPGGSVSAYAWDLEGAGFPYAAIQDELVALGSPHLGPPSPGAARLDTMRALWADAGLVDIDTTVITVARSFADFDDYWRIARTGPRIAPRVAALSAADVSRLRDRLRHRLVADDEGRIIHTARAHAIRGRVPAA